MATKWPEFDAVVILDGNGDQITSFGGSGGTSATDDDAFTAGSGSGTPAMGFFSTDTVNAGDVGVLAMDASRRLLTSLEIDNVGLLTTTAHDAAFGTAGSADAQVRSVQGIASMTPLLVDATGQGDVPITLDSEAVVLGAGSAAIGKLAANDGVDIGDVDVTSAVASSGGDTQSNLDVDTAAEQGPSIAANFGVIVRADLNNTSILYVGLDSSITDGDTDATDGFPLWPGDSVTLPVANANQIYVLGDDANQKAFYFAV